MDKSLTPSKRKRGSDDDPNPSNESSSDTSNETSQPQRAKLNNPDFLSSSSSTIFTRICFFLPLHTKFTRFRVLSKHFNENFDPSQHCKYDSLTINQSICRSFDETNVAQLCGVISIVSDIQFEYDVADDAFVARHRMQSTNQPYTRQANQSLKDSETLIVTKVLMALAHALSGSNLRSLHFAEGASSSSSQGNLELISELIEEVESINQSINLSTLSIELKGEPLLNATTDYEFVRWIDFSCLFRSSTLHTIKLYLYRCGQDESRSMLAALPPSLTYFELFHDCSFGDTVLHSLLADPEWLPQLVHFDVDGDLLSHPSLLTPMKQTGMPRPYRFLEMMLADDTLSHGIFANLEHLGIVLDCQIFDSFDQFTTIPNFAFPRLKSFSLHEEYGPTPENPCDLNPLIAFLSHRPIETIFIRLWIECSNAWEPFSNHSIASFAHMSALSQLKLDYLTTQQDWPDGFRFFESDDIRSLLPVDSWPNMKELSIVSTLPITACEAFCRASPSLKTITWRHQCETLVPLAVLAFIDTHCPLIESISLIADSSVPASESDLYYAASLNLKLSHLKSFSIHDGKMSSQTLHLIITELERTQINEFILQITPANSTRWTLSEVALHTVMQRKLRTLTSMWFPKQASVISLLESMDRQLPGGRNFPFKAIELVPDDTLVRGKLCPGVDESGQTSLDVVCDSMLRHVRAADLQRLHRFDRSNYQPAQRSNSK